MSTKYRVVVTRITEEEKKHREWVKVADTGNERDRGPQYDYGPPIVQIEKKETQVLNAEVDDISLSALSALIYQPEKRKHRRMGVEGTGFEVRA